MPVTPVDFASLLCSRLCHDLLSPVGALNNGLELLADETDEAMRARCLDLVADSANASADKLKFFRLAFGAPAGAGAETASAEVKAALDGLVRGNRRVELGWLVEQPAMPRIASKLLLNLSLIAFDTLVRGGRLDVAVEKGEVVVRAEGPKLVLDAETRAVLAGEAAPDTASARTSPAWLARHVAEAAGGTVRLGDEEAGVLLIAAALPA